LFLSPLITTHGSPSGFPSCGTFGPARWINDGDTMMNTLLYAAPMGTYFPDSAMFYGCTPSSAMGPGVIVNMTYFEDTVLLSQLTSTDQSFTNEYLVWDLGYFLTASEGTDKDEAYLVRNIYV